jgi:hypothetical protein
MAYQINKTDGSIVATVADGQLDQLSTDLTLIGKNYSGFGEVFNENLIKLLENFAGTAKPTHPIRGQIWFDASELKLKVYSGTQFLPVSSATISNTQPSTLGVGDLWFNNVDKQLYFYDGTSTLLLGPTYSQSQGLSGIKVNSILDTLNQTRVVTLFYNNGLLLGIFSSNATFTPKNAITGFTGNIQPGFNAGTITGFKFNVTSTNSDQLGGIASTTYVRKDTSNAINGQIRITTDLGLVAGGAGQANLTVNNGNVYLSNAASDKDLILNVRRGISQENAIEIFSATRTVNLYVGSDFLVSGVNTSTVNIGGALVVGGNLTVQGTTTTFNTETVTVEDKNIVLAKQTGVVPTDENASTGGFILQGATAKVFLWSRVDQAATSNSADAIAGGYNDSWPKLKSSAWTSSESVNLKQGKYYAIDGIPVIEQTSTVLGSETFRLTSAVTSIPGVTSFGKQTVVNIGPGLVSDPPYIRIENTKISTLQTNQDLEIEPNGTGNVVLLGSPKITGLADPTTMQDAATKEYVDKTTQSRNLVLSMDLSDGKPNSYIVLNILNLIAPPSEYRDSTQARILCSIINNSTTVLDINPLISQTVTTVNTPSGTASAVTNVAITQATVPAESITTTRIVKIFQISAGAWNHVSDTVLPP